MLDDDTPKDLDTNYDELWSAQAKRYQRLRREEIKLVKGKEALKSEVAC